MDDHAHRQPQKFVNLAHPLGVALGQVVVHRHHVDPVPRQRIQIAGQRGHQRLAFAGFHLGDFALVQHHAADKLHVKMAHLHRAPARLAHHRKGLGENLVQRLPLGLHSCIGVRNPFQPRRNPLTELRRLGPQSLVRKLFHVCFEGADQRHHRHQTLDQTLVRRAKNLGKNFIENHSYLRLPV